jgi:hypothetical protein
MAFSAFVGLAVIVALFPLPGYVASRIQGVEIARMQRTDARVQAVTESQCPSPRTQKHVTELWNSNEHLTNG